MREYLKSVIERKQAEFDELKKRSEESQDLDEVKSLGDQMESLKAEIDEAKAALNKEDEQRSEVPQDAELRNAQVVTVRSFGGKEKMDENEKDLQYRKAFMEFILRGKKIPAELRDDESTTTSDVASVIPTVLVNRIIEKMDQVGMILPLVTRLTIKAGVEIPTSTAKPVASWVAEGASSDRQRKATSKISFTYHKLRCEISMSMEVGTMALSAFEAKFVENVAKAMVKAIETAIISGNGDGKPKGILAETAPSGQAIETAPLSYAKICEIEGVVPEEYDNTAVWLMTKKTFMKFVALTDDNGQPIARVNFGLGGRTERYILGRPVVVNPYMNAGVTAIFNMEDYIFNTIYDMGISKKQDWDTEDLLTKAVMSVDGKVADKSSLVTFTIAEEV